MVNALTIIKLSTLTQNNTVLGIPNGMGSALAGGDWGIVRAIIESVFHDANFDVVICKLPD